MKEPPPRGHVPAAQAEAVKSARPVKGPRPAVSAEDEEEGERPLPKKNRKRQKGNPVLLYGLIGGGVVLTAAVVVLVIVLSRSGRNSNDAGGIPGGLGGGGPAPGNPGGPGAAAFLDQTKSVPPGLEWSREVVSRRGGTITFRITSQGPFSVAVVTDQAFKAMMAGNRAGINKQDVHLMVDTNEPRLERSITLPAGSSHFIIENHARQAVQFRLECFAKE